MITPFSSASFDGVDGIGDDRCTGRSTQVRISRLSLPDTDSTDVEEVGNQLRLEHAHSVRSRPRHA